MIHDRIQAILQTCNTQVPLLPPTQLYNESWLLRLMLDWFSVHHVPNHPLSFYEKSRWFSEAWLPSAFLHQPQREPLAEGWSHADGVIGHFSIGEAGKAALSLQQEAIQFVVLEAKLFSKLAAGVTHARYFDQAARTVACMAEVLKRARRVPSDVSCLGFYVLAPRSQIQQRIFANVMDRNSINRKVQRRVQGYEGDKDDWYREWFQPTFKRMTIDIISWEDVIEHIDLYEPEVADLKSFYKHCLDYNR
jgi:hypothetical protein